MIESKKTSGRLDCSCRMRADLSFQDLLCQSHNRRCVQPKVSGNCPAGQGKRDDQHHPAWKCISNIQEFSFDCCFVRMG